MAATAREVALRYVELVNAGKLEEIVDLYAEDGEVLPPNPRYAAVVSGRDALREHYQRSVGRRLPQLQVAHLYEAGNTAVVELETKSVDEDESWGVVDIFTVDDRGLIRRMAAYRRPLDRPAGNHS